jgi:hypothetical protein
MILNREELIELTGRRVKSAQVRALNYMGIEHRIRPDGSVTVLKAHVEQVLGISQKTERYRREQVEPNWDAI